MIQQASSSFRELCVSPSLRQPRTWPAPVGLPRLSITAGPQPSVDQHSTGDPKNAGQGPRSAHGSTAGAEPPAAPERVIRVVVRGGAGHPGPGY